MHPLMKQSLFLVFSIVITFLFLRISLYLSPNSNVDIAGYNIHHIFTGIVVLTLAVIPLLFFNHTGRIRTILIIVFGIGLSLILDEWVYLIATDGSDAAYLTPISLWGGIIVISLTCLYILLIAWLAKRNR